MNAIYTLADLQDWEKKTRDLSPPIRLGVLGDPVAHSLSPRNAKRRAARKAALACSMRAFQIAPDELAERAIATPARARFRRPQPDRAAQDRGALRWSTKWRSARGRSARSTPSSVRDGKLVRLEHRRSRLRRAPCARNSPSTCAICASFCSERVGERAARLPTNAPSENCERLVLVNRTFDKAQALARELAGYFSGPRVLGPEARLEAVPWEDGGACAPSSRAPIWSSTRRRSA